MVQNTAQAMAPKRLKKGGKGPLIITGAVLAVLIAAYIGLCAWASSLDTFFQGYQINGIDVGGLTAAQAQEKLTQELPEREVPIYETPDGTDPHGTENEEPLLILTLAQLGFTPESAGESVGIPFSDWAQEALDSQRGMSFFVKGFSYLSSLVRGDGMWFGFQLSGDIEAAVSDLADRLDQEAVDAAYELGEDSISITKPRDGRSVSQDALRQYLAQLDGASVKLYVSFTTIPAQTLCESCGVPDCSLTAIQPMATTRQRNIAIKMATPCFLFFTALPKVKQSAAAPLRIRRTDDVAAVLFRKPGHPAVDRMKIQFLLQERIKTAIHIDHRLQLDQLVEQPTDHVLPPNLIFTAKNPYPHALILS